MSELQPIGRGVIVSREMRQEIRTAAPIST